MPDRAIVNQRTIIGGQLLDSLGLPADGQTVTLLDGNTSIGSALTNSNGVFTMAVTFPSRGIHAITARFESANFREGSQALAELPVFMPTRLDTNLDTIASARVGDVVEILATLRDITGQVLPLARLNFSDGDRASATLATTAQGTAQFEWRPESLRERSNPTS